MTKAKLATAEAVYLVSTDPDYPARLAQAKAEGGVLAVELVFDDPAELDGLLAQLWEGTTPGVARFNADSDCARARAWAAAHGSHSHERRSAASAST